MSDGMVDTDDPDAQRAVGRLLTALMEANDE